MDYPIGTQFYSAGKIKRLCTVVDILKTYNHNGDLVKTTYVTEHEFLGQVIRSHDVKTTIDRAKLNALL
jgi:hypothetical protein